VGGKEAVMVSWENGGATSTDKGWWLIITWQAENVLQPVHLREKLQGKRLTV
jgi:hypothetical protein